MTATADPRISSLRKVKLTPWMLCTAILLGAVAAATARAPSGDPFFPRVGNRGLDVSHYDARLSYQPSNGRLRATTRIEATATEALERFTLDLVGLQVTGVSVDGAPADINRAQRKLVVVPAAPLAADQAFTIVVHYRGRPGAIFRRSGAVEGWVRTADGALTIGEPVGTATWLPCNEVLTDKASFEIALTVPRGLKGISNGRLRSIKRSGDRVTFEWSETQPMATYLAVVSIGRGRLTRSQIGGLPVWTMIDRHYPKRVEHTLSELPEIIHFLSKAFGPYPFDAAGSIVDASWVVFALESQTRPIYGFQPERTVVVHETAHQWFGNSVGLAHWPDIWLNEGFATWAQWYYAEHHGGPRVRTVFRRLLRTNPPDSYLWKPPPGRPGKPSKLFVPSIYYRGAMALEALRIKVGTPTLLKTLRRWTAEHRYGTATVDEFIVLAEEVSGHQLDQLFHRWLYAPSPI